MPNAGELNLAVALPQPTAKEFTMKHRKIERLPHLNLGV